MDRAEGHALLSRMHLGPGTRTHTHAFAHQHMCGSGPQRSTLRTTGAGGFSRAPLDIGGNKGPGPKYVCGHAGGGRKREICP